MKSFSLEDHFLHVVGHLNVGIWHHQRLRLGDSQTYWNFFYEAEMPKERLTNTL